MPRVNDSNSNLDVGSPFEPLAAWLQRSVPNDAPLVACGVGECGACTVLIDNVPAVACLTPMGTIGPDSTITTSTYLASKTPAGMAVANSLVEGYATQCGFCTAGLIAIGSWIVEARVLLETLDVSLRSLLTNHICRCTGYIQIVEAMESALELWSQDEGIHGD